MPEYLAPGVFVEEVSFRQKTIEGVSTSTTGFIGPTRFGPVRGEPPLLTSFSEFERIYGGLDPLEFGGVEIVNYMAHAVRAYFEEGGKRLYVARTYNPAGAGAFSGVASWPESDGSPAPEFTLRGRYPGEAGDARVTFVFHVGENIRRTDETLGPVLRGALNFDTVLARPTGASPAEAEVFWIERYFDPLLGRDSFRLRQDDPTAPASPGALELEDVEEVRILTANVMILPPGRFANELVWQGVSFHPDHRNAIGDIFDAEPRRRSTELYTPLVFETPLANGAAIAQALLEQPNIDDGTAILDVLRDAMALGTMPPERQVTFRVELRGGGDGVTPGVAQYAGAAAQGTDPRKSGLQAFEDLEDISIVAAPGSTRDTALGGAVIRQLITHCERMRYRIAVLDSVEGQLPADVRTLRSQIDSTRAALYYPWVRVSDPLADGEPREVTLPPSGFVTGIYARSDVERGVHKAPANEVVRLAINYEFLINRAQQEVLNPQGINCLRFFEGRGFRVWGARTTSSDPEWKYVNIRRYFAFLERSIEKGTQWVVFEPNGPVLWANVQRTVEDFLYNEFISNHLAGRKPAEAFFVRCDETTMTQNDRDNGRLICLVGVAPLYPAEFVIFRIGQKTADARG
jgi:uncharacterized protein